MISIDTKGEKTLFFDFLPVDLGEVRGFRIRLQLYTVPGQIHYAVTRKIVLRGVDGVVFVADSLTTRREKNIESLQDLKNYLNELGIVVANIPLVFQYNKRDLAGGTIPVLPLEEMERDMNPLRTRPSFSASAVRGHGVFETLRSITKQVAVSVSRKVLLDPRGSEPTPQKGGAIPAARWELVRLGGHPVRRHWI